MSEMFIELRKCKLCYNATTSFLAGKIKIKIPIIMKWNVFRVLVNAR